MYFFRSYGTCWSIFLNFLRSLASSSTTINFSSSCRVDGFAETHSVRAKDRNCERGPSTQNEQRTRPQKRTRIEKRKLTLRAKKMVTVNVQKHKRRRKVKRSAQKFPTALSLSLSSFRCMIFALSKRPSGPRRKRIYAQIAAHVPDWRSSGSSPRTW